jgi:hypothetical protein
MIQKESTIAAIVRKVTVARLQFVFACPSMLLPAHSTVMNLMKLAQPPQTLVL